MNKTDVIITNILKTGTGFGVLADDQVEQVFLASKLLLDRGLAAGDMIRCVIIPNSTHAENTPWRAISIVDDADADIPENMGSNENRILVELEYGCQTLEDLAEALGMTESKMSVTLSGMVNGGQINRFTVYELPEV